MHAAAQLRCEVKTDHLVQYILACLQGMYHLECVCKLIPYCEYCITHVMLQLAQQIASKVP